MARLSCVTSPSSRPNTSPRSGSTRKVELPMQVTLKIFRFNPEQDRKPHYESYQVEAQPTDRVLDLMEYVKGHLDGSLSFRRSCAHGVCGSDAMRINGRNRLACKA